MKLCAMNFNYIRNKILAKYLGNFWVIVKPENFKQ